MNPLPPEAPRLDPVPFIIADALLLTSAFLIGWQAEAPLGVGPLACISALVGLGAISGLYPFVINHARRQEEALRERSAQIEALARTVGAAAEQISIAVANLPAIAENSSRQLKIAEQLPADLQARLATLQHQLSATASEENAALRHELDTLRAAETDKLAVALDGLNRATADLARLESIGAKHSAALDAAISHLPRLADSFVQQATEALRRETTTAVAALHAAAAESGAGLAAATNEARAAFDRGVRDAVSHLANQATSNPPFPAHSIYRPVIATDGPVVKAPAEPLLFTPPAEARSDLPKTPAPALIDDADLDEPASPPEALVPDRAEGPESTPELGTAITSEPAPLPEPKPEKEAEATAQPEPESVTEREPESETESAEPSEPAEAEAPPEPVAEEPTAPAEAALSHDGFTRLVVTAYIGIGNKLFVRGDGPGLRSDKGMPLQFVSIGKWRWESAELLFPAKVRLYKNDQIECTILGEITLDPGHHHEVVATF